MKHGEVVDRHFQRTKRKNWDALSFRDLDLWKSFQTPRVAKLEDENHLLFTIGQTSRGKKQKLDRKIKDILKSEGFQVITGESTDGSTRPRKEYIGVNLESVGDGVALERAITKLREAIEAEML